MSFAIIDAILPRPRTYYAILWDENGARNVFTFNSRKQRKDWIEKQQEAGEVVAEVSAKYAKKLLKDRQDRAY